MFKTKYALLYLVATVMVLLYLVHATKNCIQERFVDNVYAPKYTYAGHNLIWVNDPNIKNFRYITSDEKNNLYIPNSDAYSNASLRYM